MLRFSPILVTGVGLGKAWWFWALCAGGSWEGGAPRLPAGRRPCLWGFHLPSLSDSWEVWEQGKDLRPSWLDCCLVSVFCYGKV